MPLDQKLEFYLDDIALALRPIPTSERIDILSKIKSDVVSRQQRVPPLTADEIIKELGSASSIANGYRRERGYGPTQTRMRPGLKWILVFFFAIFMLIPVTIGILIWKLTPLISIRDNGQSVKVFGGLIDLQDMDGDFQFHFGDREEGIGSHRIEGELVIPAAQKPNLSVKFKNGKFHFTSATSEKLEWHCRLTRDKLSLPTTHTNELIELDFSSVGGTSCEISIPRNVTLVAEGKNGAVDLHEPQFGARVKLNNGNVSIAPSIDEKYEYDLKIHRGRVDDFESSTEPNPIKISISLENGRIERR